MSKKSTLDVDAFARYLEARPAKLGCWRDGAAGAYPTLAWLNVHPVVEQRRLAKEVGFPAAVAMTTSVHHNQVGIAAGWVGKYMKGAGRSVPTPVQDRRALWQLADRYWGLCNALIEVRVGVRDFAAEGTRVTLAYRGNHRVDALDRVFDLVENLDSMNTRPRRQDPRLAQWLAESSRTCAWEHAPDWVRDRVRSLAADVLSRYPTYLSADTVVGGFTMGELDAYWVELMAWGMYMNAAIMHGSEYPQAIVPIVELGEVVRGMANAAAISEESSARITSLLTLDAARCPDPALTPLVPLGSGVIPMSSLIVPASPQRNTLAIVQTDPSLFGEAGRLLGRVGEHVTTETLGRLAPDTLIASRVKVFRADGSPAGDLDVVACDASAGLLAIFEIRWHIAADGNAEVYRAESGAVEKRAQVARLRREIESGEATPRWPVGWPSLGDFRWRWFVLTRDVLPTREISEDGITLRSHQLLARTLRAGASVTDLVKALDAPPQPPDALCATQWERIRYGDLRVDIELIVA